MASRRIDITLSLDEELRKKLTVIADESYEGSYARFIYYLLNNYFSDKGNSCGSIDLSFLEERIVKASKKVGLSPQEFMFNFANKYLSDDKYISVAIKIPRSFLGNKEVTKEWLEGKCEETLNSLFRE